MQNLSARTALLPVLFIGLFVQCEPIPPVASRLVYVSTSRNETGRRPSTDCAFRYSIANTFSRLDTDGQREAIRAGFDLWQKLDPNVGFLELSVRPVIVIKFTDPAEIPDQTAQPTLGLVSGKVAVTAGLRRESSGVNTILLSNAYDWDRNALTRAVAYHAGLFLGMATSAETGSIMSTLFVGQPTRATKADSLMINQLYSTTCKDLSVKYLPLALKVSNPTSQVIKFDKQGTVSIRASGQMVVGAFVGNSGPEGRETGVLGFSLASYSIEPTINHAALIYKLNGEAKWRYCGRECSFPTNGLQYADLLFNVNDLDQTDNFGAYDVAVDYK